MTKFVPGSWVHLTALAICAISILLYIPIARRYRLGKLPWLGKAMATACIAIWLLNTGVACTPSLFRWDSSLPLFYCNLANLVGAFAILCERRIFQSVLYFWACGLSVWAFLTPTLAFGPNHIGFWIFWAYHLCIGLAVTHLIVGNVYRPNRRDLLATIAVTIAYGLILVAINVPTGWNYGFLGASRPSSPTPIDLLGPFPLRLLWIALLAAGIFCILMLPWKIADMRNRKSPTGLSENPS
jgi:hypothetical integral membrane protein (TIGR02206 family)